MIRERLARAGLISLAGGGTGALFGLLLAMVVGRGLGTEGTGFFFQTVALFMILANVLELGADTGLVRSLSRQVSLGATADMKRTVAIASVPVVMVGAVALSAIWLAAPALAELIAEPPARATTTSLIQNTTPFVLVASVLAVLLGGTRGLGTVVPFTAIQNIGLPVIRVVLVATVFGVGLGLLDAARAWAWPLLIAAGAAAIVLAHQLSRTLAQRAPRMVQRTPTGALAREFWAFSAPRGVGAALEIALVWLDVLIVAALLGPTAAGIYAVVSRCALAGLLVETAARMAASPRISAAMATEDVEGASRLHLAGTRSMILLSWPFYITLACFAPVILDLFGPGFRAGAPALVVLCGGMMILTGAGMVQTVLLMGGRSHWQMSNKAVALTVNIGGNVALVPVWGILGAAATWVITIGVDAALATWQVQRRMAIGFAPRHLLLPIAIIVGTWALPGLLARVVVGVSAGSLVLHLILSGCLYATVCWRFRKQLGIESLIGSLVTRFAQTTSSHR